MHLSFFLLANNTSCIEKACMLFGSLGYVTIVYFGEIPPLHFSIIVTKLQGCTANPVSPTLSQLGLTGDQVAQVR